MSFQIIGHFLYRKKILLAPVYVQFMVGCLVFSNLLDLFLFCRIGFFFKASAVTLNINWLCMSSHLIDARR